MIKGGRGRLWEGLARATKMTSFRLPQGCQSALALIAPSIFTFSASFSSFSLPIAETLNHHKVAHSRQANLLINLMIKSVIAISAVYCLLSLVDRPEVETRSIVSSHEARAARESLHLNSFISLEGKRALVCDALAALHLLTGPIGAHA
jgi:hypothetical protein